MLLDKFILCPVRTILDDLFAYASPLPGSPSSSAGVAVLISTSVPARTFAAVFTCDWEAPW
ncbi:MAG TPA: hypothetical protein VN610_00335 [Bryobacteraceae bacterium]|nr:hypothetical protein [Bryobacteraceae bacterium]